MRGTDMWTHINSYKPNEAFLFISSSRMKQTYPIIQDNKFSSIDNYFIIGIDMNHRLFTAEITFVTLNVVETT